MSLITMVTFEEKNFFSARMRKLQQLFLLAKERCARLMFCAHQNLSCTHDSGTKGNVRSLIHKTLDVMTMWRRREAHNFPFIFEEKCTSAICFSNNFATHLLLESILSYITKYFVCSLRKTPLKL